MNFWQSKNIRFRGIDVADAAAFHAWNLDTETARFVDFIWPPTSLSSVQEWIRQECIPRPQNDQFQVAIVDRDDTVVGTLNVTNPNQSSGTFSYGFAIRPEYRRKGYGREAVLLLLRYMFEERRYQKCTVTVYSNNIASRQLHESLGFIEEGRLRRMGFSQGEYVDDVMYGITCEEYAALYGTAAA